METTTSAVSEAGNLGLIVRVGRSRAARPVRRLGRPLLRGRWLPGNPFETLRWASKRHNLAVAMDRKAEPARGEPVSHQHGADHADQCARHYIAWMMREQHQPAHRDQERIDDHEHAGTRPDRCYRESQ